MDTIKFYAPKSPIILVATHLDLFKKNRKDKVSLVREMAEKYKKYKNIKGVFCTGFGYNSYYYSPINFFRCASNFEDFYTGVSEVIANHESLHENVNNQFSVLKKSNN